MCTRCALGCAPGVHQVCRVTLPKCPVPINYSDICTVRPCWIKPRYGLYSFHYRIQQYLHSETVLHKAALFFGVFYQLFEEVINNLTLRFIVSNHRGSGRRGKLIAESIGAGWRRDNMEQNQWGLEGLHAAESMGAGEKVQQDHRGGGQFI